MLIVGATLFGGLQSAATAGLLHSQVPDNQGAVDMTGSRQADNFTLASPATLGSIRFWWTEEGPSFAGTVTYAIYFDLAGAIGSEVAGGTVSGLTYTPTGKTIGEVGFFPAEQTDITLPSPVTLAPGTYWLELHEGTSLIENDHTPVFWATSVFRRGKSLEGPGVCDECDLPSIVLARELAFELYDAEAVPEPGTMSLAALGLGVVVWLRRRR